MTSLEQIANTPVSPEREKEVIDALTRLCDKGYEDYKIACKEFKGVVAKLFFDFGRITANTQKKDYLKLKEILYTKFLSRDQERKVAGEEKIMENVINSNLKKASKDNKLAGEEKKYWIVNERERDKIGKIMQISIPYVEGNWENRQQKFAYSVLIYENKTPNIYRKLKQSLVSFSE